jgi:hypothetical protein
MLGKMTLLKISQDYHDFSLITLYGQNTIKHKKTRCLNGFVHYGGGHEILSISFLIVSQIVPILISNQNNI